MGLQLLFYLEKTIALCLSARILLGIFSQKRKGMETKIRFFSHLDVGLHIGLSLVVLLSVYEKIYAPFLAALGVITIALLWFLPNRIVWYSEDALAVGKRTIPLTELVSAHSGGFCDRIEWKSGCCKIYVPIYEPQIMDMLNAKGKELQAHG